MTSVVRDRLRWMVALCAAPLVLLLSACGPGVDVQPVIRAAQLIGRWRAPGGATMTFTPSHQFTGARLDLLPGVRACTGVSADGTWEFLNSHGDSGPSLSAYAQGQVIAVNLTNPHATCDPQFTTWQQGSGTGLCLDLDPDSPCTGAVFAKVP
jgi:hypothetical protein